VEGIDNIRNKLNDLRQAPIDFTSPPVRTKFSEVSCINSTGGQDHLLVARVDPGERVYELVNGECYLRVGDESRKLNFVQRQELEFDRGQAHYDGLPAKDVTVDSLDDDLIRKFRESVGATGSTENLLRARSLLTRDGCVTNAGYLLFGTYPQDIFPQAYIRVLRFLDVSRGTGARLGLEEGTDVRVEGPILTAVERAQSVINDLLPRRRALGETGRFEPQPIVPRDAWLEGLVNAIVHRSYSLSGDHIRVEIYPNRIEIESPGRFPGLVNPAEPLNISRFARNPRIARVCADLRIGQELGEGIRRMFDEMRRRGLSDPVYQQKQGSLRLVLTSVPRLDPQLTARLPPMSQRVLDHMRLAGKALGTGEIADLLGWSRPFVLTRLKALEAEGILRWSGKSARDPRAVWLIAPDA